MKRLDNIKRVLAEADEVLKPTEVEPEMPSAELEEALGLGRDAPGPGVYGSETGQNVQRAFNPVDYFFKWTKDWYEWDSKAAHKKAMQDRNKSAAEFKKAGWKVRKYTNRNALISRGGIGSGKPHVDMHVTIYGFDASR